MNTFKRRNSGVAAVTAWWLSQVTGLARAFQYGCAAELDERNGFPYTAAMEWRKAAELFAPETRVAEYSWRQWERIMGLPRRLAGPIGFSPAISGEWASAMLSTEPPVSRLLQMQVNSRF